jgi:hypothetical protein
MIVSNREKALRQTVQLMQDIFAGSEVGPEDVDRFRRRPQGPHGHPLLVKSERLERPSEGRMTLADLQAAPDGSPCLLWSLEDDRNFGMIAKIGLSSWHLRFDEPSLVVGGRILCFNAGGMPVVEMRTTPAAEAGAATSRIFVGDAPIKGSEDARGDFPWEVGGDGHVYRLMSDAPDRMLRCDTTYGVLSTRMLPNRQGTPVQVCVVTEDEFTFMSGLIGALPSCHVVTAADPCKTSASVIQPSDRLVRLGNEVWVEHASAGSRHSWNAFRVTSAPENESTGGRFSFHSGLTRIGKARFAYVCQTDDNFLAWVVDDHRQPVFARVSQLFKHGSRWRYWALGQQQLFLMDLPLLPLK